MVNFPAKFALQVLVAAFKVNPELHPVQVVAAVQFAHDDGHDPQVLLDEIGYYDEVHDNAHDPEEDKVNPD